MCCQCLLKQTRITTFHLSNGSHVCLKRIHPKSSLVTLLITLRLIICPSSYKARPDNLIGRNQFFIRDSFSPTEQCQTELPDLKNVVGGAKYGWYPMPFNTAIHTNQRSFN